jgi:hypothetical protein
VVSAHGVNGDGDHGNFSADEARETPKSLLSRFLRRFTLVESAVRANLVRALHFVAIRTLGQRRLGQKVVRPPGAGPTFRMPALWVRHSNTPRFRRIGRIISGLQAPGKLLFLEPVLLEARERGHSRVRRVGLTAALFMVQIRAASRAQPPAVALADHL